jgi:CBS domain-containing protein
MPKKQTKASDVTALEPSAIEPEVENKDYFLELMFFQGRGKKELAEGAPPTRQPGRYAPLAHSTAGFGENYSLPVPSFGAPVNLESPATEVMTDLRRVSAVTIDPDQSIVEANNLMIARGVRALFVVDAARQILGLMTATDIFGERPIQFAQARGIRYDEVQVRDIMTQANRLEVLAFEDVLRARVGDIVATLRLAGRQHALVVEAADDGTAQRTACGIFSLTQIARQLGIEPQQEHDIARTFAEIEAVIAS